MQWREDAIDYKKIEDKLKVGNRRIGFTVRVPDEAVVERNVLLVPGILAEQHALSPLAKSLAQLGIASVTMDDPTHPDDVLYLSWEIESRLHSSTTLAGHSLGGIHALEAAQWAHEGTDLLLMQPAGFGGVRSLHAFESLRTDRPDNSHAHHELKAVRDGLVYAVKNARELRRLVRKAESDVGIELGKRLPEWMGKRALLFADDRLVLPQPCWEGLDKAGFSVAMLRNTRAGHNAPMYYVHEVADAVASMVVPVKKDYAEAA